MATRETDAKVDADAVKEIIDTDLTETQINNFINMAYYRSLPLAGNLGDCGGDDMLGEIQKNLAAHFITMREPETQSERMADGASVTFAGQYGMGLKRTRYGQTALDLDCSGKLASSGLKKIGVHVYGHEDFTDDDNDD